jgi:hypothetical protein
MSEWMILLVVVAALYVAYIAIYSSSALLFGWPKFHRGDWKEIGLGLLIQAVIGIPALLLVDKYFPALPKSEAHSVCYCAAYVWRTSIRAKV